MPTRSLWPSFNVRKRRTRDGQKSKLYRAEQRALNMFARMEFGSAVECEIFVGRVLANKRAWAAVLAAGKPFAPAKTLWPGRVRVHQMRNNGRGANASRSFSEINIARTAMTKAVLLHELAHICTPDDVGHGAQYAAVYLALVKSVLGTESAKALKASFKAGKVRFKPKRTLSPERKAALVATLAAARAKKAAIKQMPDAEYIEYVAAKHDGAVPLEDERAYRISINEQSERIAARRRNHDIALALANSQ